MSRTLNPSDKAVIDTQDYNDFSTSGKSLLVHLWEFFCHTKYESYGCFNIEGIPRSKEYVEPITGQIMNSPAQDKFLDTEGYLLTGEDLGLTFDVRNERNINNLMLFSDKFDVLYYRITFERFSIMYTEKLTDISKEEEIPQLKKAHWMLFSSINK